ncbi:MAG: hypothetical protein V4689_09060 [Verrucomicrobiota bacterium]
MKSNSLKFLLSAGLFLLPAMSAQAGLKAVLNVDINGYFQAKKSVSGGIESGQVGVVRLESKQLLSLIAQEMGIRFSNGSLLMVSDQAEVYVADAAGNFITNVSPYVKLELKKGNELLHGKVNILNGKEDSRTYFPLALRLNLTKLQGTLHGIGIEEMLVTQPDGDGVQIFRGNTNCSLNGKGVINGGAGLFDGVINIKGRNADVD